MIHIIGGLSGCGKSSIGHYLRKDKRLFWFELDTFPRDAVDDYRIRAEWENLLRGNAELMVHRFPNPMVLTIPSMPIFKSANFKSHPKIRVSYLIGPEEACIQALALRDSMSLTDASNHWRSNNRALLEFIRTECPKEWQVNAFNSEGTRRAFSEIAKDVLEGNR